MRLRRGGEGESRGPPRAWAAVGREGKRSALAGDLDRLATAVPVAAAVATATALRRGRRRAAVNEALHELRRPLQALALGGGEAAGGSGPGDPLRLARAALERLEREVNGAAPRPATPRPISARPLLEMAVGRWRRPAAAVGASLQLRWRCGDVLLRGDADALDAALDNLIANALEHGGPRIAVVGATVGGRLRITIVDSGPRAGLGARRGAPRGRAAALLVALSGRRRRGHGLRIVRRVAAEHGGDFRLLGSPAGTLARLELPVAERRR